MECHSFLHVFDSEWPFEKSKKYAKVREAMSLCPNTFAMDCCIFTSYCSLTKGPVISDWWRFLMATEGHISFIYLLHNITKGPREKKKEREGETLYTHSILRSKYFKGTQIFWTHKQMQSKNLWCYAWLFSVLSSKSMSSLFLTLRLEGTSEYPPKAAAPYHATR